jgi:adenylate cyclase
MSKDPDQDFFSDGITQDIITELSHFNEPFIIAPRTSFQFKDKAMSSYEVGKALEAEYIVDGSVRRAGDRVRITAQLTEVESESHLWADRYDRDLEDVFAIQEEVAQEIAAAVPGKIEEASFERVLNRSSQNLTAYEYVLRGEWHRGQDYGSPQAVPYFEKAIAADPICARAYANLAAWHAYSAFTPLTCFEDVQSKVRTYSDKALIVEPNDPVILETVAYVYLLIGDLDLSRKFITRAIRINSNNYRVMASAALIMAWLGETKESLDWLERFTQHDPLSQAVFDEVGLEVYYMAERYDDAITAMAGWADFPVHVAAMLAATHAQAGRIWKRPRHCASGSRPKRRWVIVLRTTRGPICACAGGNANGNFGVKVTEKRGLRCEDAQFSIFAE